MVIARYISKEILGTFSAMTFILLFIALSNKFVMFLAKAASGKLPIDLVMKVVALFIPELFGMLAPVAMFIAILFTHSRLHADSEVAVLLTSGFDWARLVRITVLIAASVAVIVGLINILVVPKISLEREKLIADGQVSGVIHAITPGRFQTVEDNDHLVFYVEDILPDGSLHNIFIAQQPNPEKAEVDKSVVVVTAKTAHVKQQEKQNEFYLVLHQGFRYVGVPGSKNYSVTSFEEYGRELRYTSEPIPSVEYLRPSGTIFKSTNPGDIAEMQWRCAMPITLIILALIAIPLAKVQPRQGRYAKFLPAVLIYMAYYNLLTIVRRSIANGSIGSLPGLWGVHIGMLLFAIILLLVVSGRWHEFRYKLSTRNQAA